MCATDSTRAGFLEVLEEEMRYGDGFGQQQFVRPPRRSANITAGPQPLPSMDVHLWLRIIAAAVGSTSSSNCCNLRCCSLWKNFTEERRSVARGREDGPSKVSSSPQPGGARITDAQGPVAAGLDFGLDVLRALEAFPKASTRCSSLRLSCSRIPMESDPMELFMESC